VKSGYSGFVAACGHAAVYIIDKSRQPDRNDDGKKQSARMGGRNVKLAQVQDSQLAATPAFVPFSRNSKPMAKARCSVLT
jgi:hypothetical protein